MNPYTAVVYAVICSQLFLVTILSTTTTLTTSTSTIYVTGFELPGRNILSNRTKSRLMIPLRIDKTVLGGRVATTAAAGDHRNDLLWDVRPGPPRGIVLNTVVGGLAFAGGMMGFVIKGSKPSLIAGSTFGGLLLLSAVLISASKKSHSPQGNMLGSMMGGLLGYVMGKKFLLSKKFMPSGLLAFMSVMNVVYNLIEIKILWSNNNNNNNNSNSNSK